MDIDWIVTLWSALVVLVATTVHGITGVGAGHFWEVIHDLQVNDLVERAFAKMGTVRPPRLGDITLQGKV